METITPTSRFFKKLKSPITLPAARLITVWAWERAFCSQSAMSWAFSQPVMS